MTSRPARDDEADRAFLYALFVSTKAAEAAAMPIDAAGKDLLLAMQYRSMTATYRRDYPTARWEVVELADESARVCSSRMWGTAASPTPILRFCRERSVADWRRALPSRALEEPRRARITAGPSERSGAECGVAQAMGTKSDLRRWPKTPPFVELERRP